MRRCIDDPLKATTWHSRPDSVAKITPVKRTINLERDTRHIHGTWWPWLSAVSLYDLMLRPGRREWGDLGHWGSGFCGSVRVPCGGGTTDKYTFPTPAHTSQELCEDETGMVIRTTIRMGRRYSRSRKERKGILLTCLLQKDMCQPGLFFFFF